MYNLLLGTSSSDESDDEGWILITHKRGRKKNISNSKSVPKRVRMVEVISQTPKAANQNKAKFIKSRKTFPPFKTKGTLQKARRPITLSEYMPKEFRGVLNTLSCYQIEGENETNAQEITNPQHDAYSACVDEITFISDDLLLGTKFHNRPLFVTGFIRE